MYTISHHFVVGKKLFSLLKRVQVRIVSYARNHWNKIVHELGLLKISLHQIPHWLIDTLRNLALFLFFGWPFILFESWNFYKLSVEFDDKVFMILIALDMFKDFLWSASELSLNRLGESFKKHFLFGFDTFSECRDWFALDFLFFAKYLQVNSRWYLLCLVFELESYWRSIPTCELLYPDAFDFVLV